MNKKIEFECKVDGYRWVTTPEKILNRKQGCPKCGGHMLYTNEEFQLKLDIVNPMVTLIGDYVNYKTPVEVECKIHKVKWITQPHCLMVGCGCPKCNISNGERTVMYYLDRYNINYKSQFIFDDLRGKKNRPFRFDFAIYHDDSLYCLIEVDGAGHRNPINFKNISDEKALLVFNSTKDNDLKKNNYCDDHNIILHRIFYDGDILYVIKQLHDIINPLIQ